MATGLRAGPTGREPAEQDVQHRWVADGELVDMVRRGLVVDAATVAAYALLTVIRGSATPPGRPPETAPSAAPVA